MAVMATPGRLLTSCLLGSDKACRALRLIIRPTIYGAGSLVFDEVKPDEEHVNQLPFRGVLLVCDQPSNKPPHGSRGHRILVPLSAAKKRLQSIIDQGINYDSQDLNEHKPTHKVGVITKAWIEGTNVWVSGIIWKKDFPEASKDLGRGDLGMSMELANVYVRNENEDVWHLLDFQFTGATLLRRDAAAYTNTSLRIAASQKSLAASKAAASGGGSMKKQTKKVAAAGITVEALAAAIEQANSPLVKAVNTLNSCFTSLSGRVDELGGVLIQASGTRPTDDEDEEEEVTIKAKGVKAKGKDEDDDDDEEDMSAGKDDDDDDEDEDDDDDMSAAKKDDNAEEDGNDDEGEDSSESLAAELEDLEEKKPHAEPGQVGKNFKTKGNKTTTTEVGAAKVFPGLVKGKKMKASATIQAAAIRINELSAAYEKLQRKVTLIEANAAKKERKLKKRIEVMQAQQERFAEQEGRRSALPVDLVNLAAKANVDLREVKAAGVKMTTEQVDAMFASSGVPLDPTTRMAMKNRMVEQGIMEQGEVTRY